jgi:hypothetical protein
MKLQETLPENIQKPISERQSKKPYKDYLKKLYPETIQNTESQKLHPIKLYQKKLFPDNYPKNVFAKSSKTLIQKNYIQKTTSKKNYIEKLYPKNYIQTTFPKTCVQKTI